MNLCFIAAAHNCTKKMSNVDKITEEVIRHAVKLIASHVNSGLELSSFSLCFPVLKTIYAYGMIVKKIAILETYMSIIIG